MSRPWQIYYDSKLVEEAVFYARHDPGLALELDEQRGRVYQVSDPEERERAFRALYQSWFEKCDLGQPIDQALSEQPLIVTCVSNCYVVAATYAKEEAAELYVNAEGRRTLRITLRPETLLNLSAAQLFLRNELFHIADMIDPAFGYQPTLPKSPDGPTYDNFITNRYRVLWNVTISGRMARRGWLPATARQHALSEFNAAFPMLGDDGGKAFERFYESAQTCHTELAIFAFDPLAASDQPRLPSAPATHCPLCKFPSHAFEPTPQKLAADVQAEITADFPNWSPEAGLCIQCADLYRGRQMSLAALRTLPGYNSAAL